MVSEKYQHIESESKQSLMKNVEDISFPRLVGSEGEKKCQSLLMAKIEELGYQPQTEASPASLYRINFLQSLSNVAAGILFLFATICFNIHPLLFLLPLSLIFVNIYMVSTGSIEMGQPPNVPKWVKILDTHNIYAETPKKDGNLEIVFVGHYDSKSTKLTGAQRVISYVFLLISAIIVLGAGILGTILYFTSFYDLSGIKTLMWFASSVGMVAGIVLAFNVVGNKSPGASDNGTAVAIVLELMRYFKVHPIEGVNFTFLFSAAEEIGLTGSFNFIFNRKDDPAWASDKTFVINWDLAGLPGPVLVNTGIGIPKKETSKTMNSFLDHISKEQDIPSQQLYLPIGGWHDGLPFIQYGYECATITGKSYKIHSKNDMPGILDQDNLFQSYLMGIELVEKLIESKNK